MQSNLQVREVHTNWELCRWIRLIECFRTTRQPTTHPPNPDHQAAFVAVEGDLTAWVTSSQGAGGPVTGAKVTLYFSKGYNSVSGRMGVSSAWCCCLCKAAVCFVLPSILKKPRVSNQPATDPPPA